MKRFKYILRILLLVTVVTFSISAHAQDQDSLMQDMDSVEISLLTCSPGQEVWSYYGHTALRYNDKKNNNDLCINWGMFSFKQEYFVLRFVFGITDYEMGIIPTNYFMVEYAKEGRAVEAEVLNLTREEKMAISLAISENYQPANRTYRYNYFKDNCTTRARDMILTHLQGKVEFPGEGSDLDTYRKNIHHWTENHRWAKFGNDLLLGVKADSKLDREEQQFLPVNLSEDFDRAVIVDATGKKRPLVDSIYNIIDVNEANVQRESTIWDKITPNDVALFLIILTLLISFIEHRRKKLFWLYDLTLLTLTGLAGLVLTAMIFSKHPTVSFNLQILILNPLNLIFAYPVINQLLKGKIHWYWRLLWIMNLIALPCALLQNYAEGMLILALILIVRSGNAVKTLKNK